MSIDITMQDTTDRGFALTKKFSFPRYAFYYVRDYGDPVLLTTPLLYYIRSMGLFFVSWFFVWLLFSYYFFPLIWLQNIDATVLVLGLLFVGFFLLRFLKPRSLVVANGTMFKKNFLLWDTILASQGEVTDFFITTTIVISKYHFSKTLYHCYYMTIDWWNHYLFSQYSRDEIFSMVDLLARRLSVEKESIHMIKDTVPADPNFTKKPLPFHDLIIKIFMWFVGLIILFVLIYIITTKL